MKAVQQLRALALLLAGVVVLTGIGAFTAGAQADPSPSPSPSSSPSPSPSEPTTGATPDPQPTPGSMPSSTDSATPSPVATPSATATPVVKPKGAMQAAAPAAASGADHLLVAAVFGANSDTVRWTNDWVELYNPTDSPITLGTIDTATNTVSPKYDLCYRTYASTGTCNLIQLYGTVAPHHYFFVWYANAHKPADDGTYPRGFTPDLDFAVKSSTNGNQSGSDMGGCNTGGQIQLLDATKRTTAVNGDLSTDAAKTAGVVDGVGWMHASTDQPSTAESKGSSKVTGLDSGTNNSCVIARKLATGGLPVDTDANNADFAPVTDLNGFAAHSQHDDRVAITPIDNTEISLNQPMPSIQVRATAVYGALTYSATGLPTGVGIDPTTGVISGTPTSSTDLGVHQVSVTVADGVASDTATVTFDLTVSTRFRVDPIADVSARRGTALSALQVGAHGGTTPYRYAATGLPTGVTINASTGVISGTPTAPLGRYLVTVSVTDGAQATATTTFGIVETPTTGGPAAGDPLAGLRLNEVRATGTAAKDWVEIYNTGAALTSASVTLEDARGEVYQLPARAIAAQDHVVVDGPALDAAGLHLSATDTLYLAESDGTLLDQTTLPAYPPTSWARTTDGTGVFGVSAYPTKGTVNSGAPVIGPNDLLVTEVNYDNNSTDYYEYSEVTNTTDHPIDFSAYGLTLTKSGATMTLHDPADTSKTSPLVDPVIPAHGTQLFWWVEDQYLGVKTTSQFLSNYGLPASTPVVLVNGFSSLANSGGDHSYDLSVNQGKTLISRAYVDTPCAANTFNGSSVCTATNNNYAEHYQVPADRSSADASVWYNSLATGGDDINHPLKTRLSSPGGVDLEQPGFTRSVKITAATTSAITLHNTATGTVDLSGYQLQKNGGGTTYRLPTGTTIAGGADLTITAATSGLSFADRDYLTLLAPRGYAYSDGAGIADTTGPLLTTLPYDASSGEPPVIDPTTGLPLPPAGGLYRPAGISARNGTVHVANTGDNLVATIANGSNTIVAGSLTGYGDVGDEGPASDALLYQPGGVAEDAAGNLFIADSGDNVVRKVTTDGKIHRVAGTGSTDAAGAAISPTSTALSVNLWHPNDVVVDSSGNLLIADTNDNRVVKVTPTGAITLVAGTGRAGYSGDGGQGSAARLALPAGIAVDSHDNVYIADSSNNVVRRVDSSSGVITTVAGNYAAAVANDCLGGYGGDGGPATSALLNDPQGIALDDAGDLFIADTFNHGIRKVAPDGTISTLINSGAVAGVGNASPAGNGSLPQLTKMNTPYAVAVDPVTNVVYAADTKNNSVVQVTHAAFGGSTAGPLEPAGQVSVTGSGAAASACAALANGPLSSLGAPRVLGSPTVGATLTADPGRWSPTADSYGYQWLRDGVAIPGATGPTYVATAQDGGHLLAVAVTAARAEYRAADATSAAVLVLPVRLDALRTHKPTIAGTARVGRRLKAKPHTWRAGAVDLRPYLTYQWYANGHPIAGATHQRFKVKHRLRGKRISVRVTGAYAGFATVTRKSKHAVAHH